MNENLNTGDFISIREKSNGELYAATKNKDGSVNGVKPSGVENPDFLRFDKNANVLENFFENFMRQVKDPTRFEFFRIPAEKFNETFQKLQDAFRNPDKPENKELIDMHRINPDDFLKNRVRENNQSHPREEVQTPEKTYAINPDRVNWQKFERYGITRESLEKSGNADKLLDYRKTDLMPVSIKFDDETLRSDARFSLRKQDDGTFTPNIHLIRHKPDLEHPYFGVKFNEDDKKKLLSTGNLGRVVEAEFKQGEKTPVLLSLDKQTNELVPFRKEWVKVPDTYKGASLNEEQKQKLSEGKAVRVEDMISSKGKNFSADVQFNADKRYFELIFDNNKKQSQNQRQDIQQGETKDVHIPKKLLGVDLSEKERDKLKAGQTVYIAGMKDKEGQDFNAYVKVNPEKNKLDFFQWNPDKTKKQGAEVTPDEKHKIQVAKNNEGKTTEANKNVKEPMKSGQTKLTEKQDEKQTEKLEKEEKPRKRMKMS